MGLQPEAVGAAGVGVVLAVGDDAALALGDAGVEGVLLEGVGDPLRVLRVRRVLLAPAHPRQARALLPVHAVPARHRDRLVVGPDVGDHLLAVLDCRALFFFGFVR